MFCLHPLGETAVSDFYDPFTESDVHTDAL